MDERLAAIEKQKQDALNQSNQTYGGMLQNNEDLYNQQKNYADEYERSQNDALDKQLAFQEQLINQQKETARQNMETESKKAKNDYFSYINPYGLQAESLASRGLLNSGISETAKLGGYNTYQNRLATANKAMQDAFVQYDNDINQARLTNDVQKAQNALKRLEMQLQYSENYYNQKNSITQNQLANNQSLDSEYYNRYNTEYNNIQEEKAREEAIRQWEAEMAEKQRQYNENLAYQNRQLAEQQRQYNEQMAYQKAQDALAQQNWEKEYALAKKSSSSSSSSSKKSSSSSKTILTNGNGTKLNNGNNNNNNNTGNGATANTLKPRLSVSNQGFSKEGYEWFKKNFPDSLAMTAEEIENKLAEGIQKGMIPKSKMDIILQRYGL